MTVKVPYLRIKGQQGLIAGDLLGLFTLAGAHASGSEATLAAYLGSAVLTGSSAITLTTAETAAFTQILGGLGNVAYGEAACGAYQKGAAANAFIWSWYNCKCIY